MHHTTPKPTVTYHHPRRADRGTVTHATLGAAYRHALKLSLAGYGTRLETRRAVTS